MSTSVIPCKEAEWKSICPEIKPMINYGAVPVQLLDPLKDIGCEFFDWEMLYYYIAKKSVNTEGHRVSDFSTNKTEEYLRSLVDPNITCIAADSIDDISRIVKANPRLHIIIRLSRTGAINDPGFMTEDAPALFDFIKSKNVEVGILFVAHWLGGCALHRLPRCWFRLSCTGNADVFPCDG